MADLHKGWVFFIVDERTGIQLMKVESNEEEDELFGSDKEKSYEMFKSRCYEKLEGIFSKWADPVRVKMYCGKDRKSFRNRGIMLDKIYMNRQASRVIRSWFR